MVRDSELQLVLGLVCPGNIIRPILGGGVGNISIANKRPPININSINVSSVFFHSSIRLILIPGTHSHDARSGGIVCGRIRGSLFYTNCNWAVHVMSTGHWMEKNLFKKYLIGWRDIPSVFISYLTHRSLVHRDSSSVWLWSSAIRTDTKNYISLRLIEEVRDADVRRWVEGIYFIGYLSFFGLSFFATEHCFNGQLNLRAT